MLLRDSLLPLLPPCSFFLVFVYSVGVEVWVEASCWDLDWPEGESRELGSI